MTNSVQICGYLYSHNLTEGVSQKGNTYIRGQMHIALDEDFTRVVPVQWLVMESRKDVFDTIKRIMNTGVTVENNTDKGHAGITKVRVSGNVDINDFISRTTGQMVSYQQIRGAFIHLHNDVIPEDNDCTFKLDVYLNQCEDVDPENGASNYLQLRGFAFDFRNHLIPLTLSTCTEEGYKFFDSQSIDEDNPFFSNVWGKVEPSTVVSTQEVDSSEIGFGEPIVQETTRNRIDWLVTGASFGKDLDDSTVTPEDVAEAMKDRQADLAAVRSRYEDSNTSASTGFGGGTKNNSSGGYVF